MAGIQPILPLLTPSSSSQGWDAGGFSFVPELPKPRDAEETALQKLEALWLAQQRKKSRGFLGGILHGSWKGVSSLLDLIARPSYGLAEGTRRALHGESNDFDFGDFLSGLYSGLSGKSKTGFGQVLEEHDIGSGRRARGILGFALDVATDPIMLASVAAAPVTGGASLAALEARLAARGLTASAVTKAARVAEHGSDNVAELREARDILTSAGDGFTARATLADMRIREYVSKQADDRVIMETGKFPDMPNWSPAAQSELHGLQAFALAEARNDLPRVISFTYKIPFAKKTKSKYFENGRVVLRTPVKTVGMKTIADLRIPMVSKVAERLGAAFKPGWRNEKFHALERVGRATAEVREREYLGAIGHLLRPFIDEKSPKFLSTEHQLDALDWGETHKGVVRNGLDEQGHIRERILDRRMVKKAVDDGELSPLQAEFLHNWQKATNVLADADYDYGRFYDAVAKSANKDQKDVIYVPHIYDKTGRKITGTSILTTPGFQKDRLGNIPKSVKELRELYESGKFASSVETDPVKLLAMRARRGAQSHADSMIEKVIATSEGIPMKIANVTKQKEHLDAIAEREAKIAKLPLSTPEGYRQAAIDLYAEISAKVDVRRNAQLTKFDTRTTQLRKEIKALTDSLRRKVGLPTGNQLVHLSSKNFNEIFAADPRLRPLRPYGQKVRSVYSAAQSSRRNMRAFAPSETRIQKGAYFHVAPKSERDAIKQNGIQPNVTSGKAKGRLQVYKKLENAQKAAAKGDFDVWVINPARATKFTTKNPAGKFTIAHAMDRSDVRLFQGTHAARVSGEKYHDELTRLMGESKMTVPRLNKKSSRAAQMATKYARAWNRDLEATRKLLLDTPMQRRRADGLLDNWENRLKEAIIVLERRARQDWDNYLKDVGYKAPPRNRKAVLAAKRRALKNHTARRDEIDARFDARRDAAFAKQIEKLNKKSERQSKSAAVQRKLIDKHARKVEYHETSMDNPAAHRKGFVKNEKIKAENGKPMAIPIEIDEAITRIRQNIHDDQFVEEFSRAWSRLMGKWKVGVTVINPGYRLRNTMSDMWNMFVSPEGGVPVWAMAKYGGMAGDIIWKKIPAGDRKAVELFQEAYEHSVMSGLFGGDIERVLRTMRGGLKDERVRDLARDKKFIKAYTSLATRFNRDAENWGRLTHYLYRRLYQGKSPQEAARIVRISHFDYEDLTPFERKVKGYLIPFYTWTRNNIPYQLQSIITNPGRYSAFPKFVNEMEYAAGGDDGIAPDWIKQNLGFRVPFGGPNNFFLPQFGPSDLAKLQSGKQFAGLLGPLVKVPAELMTNKSLLTGAPIYGSELAHPRTPVSGLAAPLLSLIPGSNVGQTSRLIQGKKMTGVGASPLLSYIAGQTPLSNIFVNQMSDIRRAQRGRNASLLSYFGGVSTYAPDKEQTLGIAEQEYTERFRQFLRGLRDEGLFPEPEEREPSAFDKKRRTLLQAILANQ